MTCPREGGSSLGVLGQDHLHRAERSEQALLPGDATGVDDPPPLRIGTVPGPVLALAASREVIGVMPGSVRPTLACEGLDEIRGDWAFRWLFLESSADLGGRGRE